MSGGRSGLAHSASRGVIVTMGGLWGRTLIQLGSTLILSRLLEPRDFGLVAIMMAVLGLLDMVRDFGLLAAIMQVKHISADEWGSLLWLSTLIGGVLTALFAVSAPLLAHAFDQDRLLLLVLAASPVLLINGIGMPLQAVLQRDLEFGVLAKIDVVAMTVGVTLGVGAAFAGFGVWSLVILAGTGTLYRTVALYFAAGIAFGPPYIGRGVVPFLTAGSNVMGSQLLMYLVTNADNLIIGQRFSAAILGQYTRAYALFLLPTQQVSGALFRVALPVLSRLQDDAATYRRYIRAALLVIASVTFPVYAISAAASEPLIRVLLGPGWSQAADIFALLAIAGVTKVIFNIQIWIHISLGRVRRQLVFTAFYTVAILGSFLIGIRLGGVEGLALAYGIASVVLLVPGFWFAIQGTFISTADILVPVIRPGLIGATCFGVSDAVAPRVTDLPSWVQVLAIGAAGVGVIAAAHVFPGVRRDTALMWDFVGRARKSAPEVKVVPVPAQEGLPDPSVADEADEADEKPRELATTVPAPGRYRADPADAAGSGRLPVTRRRVQTRAEAGGARRAADRGRRRRR